MVSATARALGYLSTAAANRAQLDDWLSRFVERTDGERRVPRATVAALDALVQRTADLRMLAATMFEQRPAGLLDRYALSSSARVRDWDHLMVLVDAAISRVPAFDPNGLVGVLPIYSVLQWFLCTPAGARLFIDPRVNAALKPILDEWGAMLAGEASRDVLSSAPDGWFGKAALAEMPAFAETYACNPAAPYHGFGSWDDFFTRRLRPGVRPVVSPADASVIVNACEAAPQRMSTDVARTDTFWIKDYPYSLDHMLADASLVDRFEGGTVYQGLLGAVNYHRWHSPVTGRIASVHVEPGIYYWIEPSASLAMAGAIESQFYLAHLSTRAVIAIEADNSAVGLMCVVAIGLMECSTCEPTVRVDDRIDKGDELGMFHFGGSSHCLVFRPGVRLEFDFHGERPGPDAKDISVNARIATALNDAT